MHRIALCCLALCLAACDAADRGAPSEAGQAAPQPPSDAAAAVDSAAGESPRPDTTRTDTSLVGTEEFAYETEMYAPALLSPWSEADPTRYSGTYAGEFGDTGYRAVVEVRRGEGGYQVTGVLESMTAGAGEDRTPFGPVPLRLDGGTARFATPGGSAAFLVFSRETGEAPMRGLLVGDQGQQLFYAKEEPES